MGMKDIKQKESQSPYIIGMGVQKLGEKEYDGVMFKKPTLQELKLSCGSIK